MDAAQIKENLTVNDVYDLLVELDAQPQRINNTLVCRTICHGGHKHKLVYYDGSKTFSCFTDNCGRGFDIFNLVGKVFGMDFSSSLHYVSNKFNIRTTFVANPVDRVDTAFIKKFEPKENKIELLEPIDTNLLNYYYQFYHKSWIDDNISKKVMRDFNVLFSIRENKIIIPHFNPDGKLLGIRGRALNEDEIKSGRKYMPVFIAGDVRKHLTGANIYGLEVTKNKVKENKTLILFESEKGPMQLNTMRPDLGFGGGISGSYLTDEQLKIMIDLDVENVVLGLDKEFVTKEEEIFYKKKVASGFLDKLVPYFNVSLLWDKKGLLNEKDSPTDQGVEVFNALWNDRIFI